MSNKIYVLDTNVLLSDPTAIAEFDDNTIVIPQFVLEELDSIKSRGTDVSKDARAVIRTLDGLITGNEATALYGSDGVSINSYFKTAHPDGKLFIFPATTIDRNQVQDVNIINSCLAIGAILVSRDINMRLLATAMGVSAQDYRSDVVIRDSDHIRTGYVQVPEEYMDTIQSVEVTSTKEGAVYKVPSHTLPEHSITDYVFNTTVMFQVSGIDKVDGFTYMKSVPSRKVWGVRALNPYQAMAINSLMSKDVDLTVLLGPAGTGKSLLTIAAALEQITEKKQYKRLIYTRSQDSQFEEIGFLPGTEHDKVLPWVGAAVDSIEWLHRDAVQPDKAVEHVLERYVQFKALNFIRGRSFSDTILVIDEAQNLTATQMKTILTRAGTNCKIVLMGNLAQIDNKYVTPVSSGLTYVTEKFKDWPYANVIQLEGVVRSRLADFSENNL